MKKIILFLVVFVSSFSWEAIEQINEFKEKTGSVILGKSSKDNQSSFSIIKDKTGIYLAIISNEYIGGKGANNVAKVKIKLDSDEIVELNGIVPDSNNYLVFIINQNDKVNNLLQKMQKNNNMKVVIEKYNDRSSFTEFDITNLSDALLKLK